MYAGRTWHRYTLPTKRSAFHAAGNDSIKGGGDIYFNLNGIGY